MSHKKLNTDPEGLRGDSEERLKRNKKANPKFFSPDYVNDGVKLIEDRDMEGASDKEPALSVTPVDSEGALDTLPDTLADSSAELTVETVQGEHGGHQQYLDDSITQLKAKVQCSQTMVDNDKESPPKEGAVNKSDDFKSPEMETGTLQESEHDTSSETLYGDSDLLRLEKEKLKEMERSTHTINVLSVKCCEYHESNVKAVVDSKEEIIREIKSLKGEYDKQFKSLQTELSKTKEKLSHKSLENEYLEKELGRLKSVAMDLNIEQGRCHELELNLQGVRNEMASARASFELKVQALEQQINFESEAKSMLALLNKQLKEQVDRLTVGNRLPGGSSPSSDQVPGSNNDTGTQSSGAGNSTSPRVFEIKYTEDKNPVLSAFNQLDPPLEWDGDKYLFAETAFHCEKLKHPFCPLPKAEKIRIKNLLMEQTSAKDVKSIADSEIPNTPEWEQAQFKVLENIMFEVMDQYQMFRDKLYETMGGIITHPVGGVWRKKYPEILMKVRDEYTPSSVSVPSVGAVGIRKKWQHVSSDHKIGLYGDSLLNDAEMDTFPRNTSRVNCSTAAELCEYTQDSPINDKAEVILSSVGINDIRDGKSVDEVVEGVSNALTLLGQRRPNAKICYSSMIIKKGSQFAKSVSECNELIEKFCENNLIVFMKHFKLMMSPNEFRDDFHLANASKYFGRLKKELPKRDRSRSPAPNRNAGSGQRGMGYQRGTSQGGGRGQRGRGRGSAVPALANQRGRGSVRGSVRGQGPGPNVNGGRGRGVGRGHVFEYDQYRDNSYFDGSY